MVDFINCKKVEVHNMDILIWIIFGGIVGWVASIIMKSSGGLLVDIVLGIVGAFLGGFIMNLLGNQGVTGFNLYSFVVALIGAMVVIWIGRRFAR
jgi:uncharacterized membrane protein YeaQ/YmgE (transglycosylase-associated protein family)